MSKISAHVIELEKDEYPEEPYDPARDSFCQGRDAEDLKHQIEEDAKNED